MSAIVRRIALMNDIRRIKILTPLEVRMSRLLSLLSTEKITAPMTQKDFGEI